MGTENTEGEFGGLSSVAAHFLGESGKVGADGGSDHAFLKWRRIQEGLVRQSTTDLIQTVSSSIV